MPGSSSTTAASSRALGSDRSAMIRCANSGITGNSVMRSMSPRKLCITCPPFAGMKTARLDAAFVGGEITIARSADFFTVRAVVSDQLDITAAGERTPDALAARRDRAHPKTNTLAAIQIRQIGQK